MPDALCYSCGHTIHDHIEEDDNAYCLGNTSSTHLPHFGPDRNCPCKRFVDEPIKYPREGTRLVDIMKRVDPSAL